MHRVIHNSWGFFIGDVAWVTPIWHLQEMLQYIVEKLEFEIIA